MSNVEKGTANEERGYRESNTHRAYSKQKVASNRLNIV